MIKNMKRTQDIPESGNYLTLLPDDIWCSIFLDHLDENEVDMYNLVMVYLDLCNLREDLRHYYLCTIVRFVRPISVRLERSSFLPLVESFLENREWKMCNLCKNGLSLLLAKKIVVIVNGYRDHASADDGEYDSKMYCNLGMIMKQSFNLLSFLEKMIFVCRNCGEHLLQKQSKYSKKDKRRYWCDLCLRYAKFK